MTIQTLLTAGVEQAIHAMRNPMDSWDYSDSEWEEGVVSLYPDFAKYIVGPKDKDLSERLQKAGPEHAKHLRMIMVWADIVAPRYWWTEFDTYRAGVEKLSCSTMHTITKRAFDASDFQQDDTELSQNAAILNATMMDMWREMYLDAKDDLAKQKEIWRCLIQNLPQSYLQRRTVMMSYAALRNIVKQRKGHKLDEWKWFIDWARTLPDSWMIFDGEE